jgi:hypothetical protein
MAQLSVISISLQPPFPEAGLSSAIVRLTHEEKRAIDLAARHMGMSRSMLMRVLLTRGAERIIRELGIKEQYTNREAV